MKLNLFSDNDFKSSVLEKKFSVKTSSKQISCIIPKEKKFKVENLFEFRRITGDLTLSLVFLLFVIFLFLNFNTESGWDTRNLPQKRVGKILKQQWVGPLLCMVILIPATFINLYESFKALKKSQRLKIPNKIRDGEGSHTAQIVHEPCEGLKLIKRLGGAA